jgi:hypothetical protein
MADWGMEHESVSPKIDTGEAATRHVAEKNTPTLDEDEDCEGPMVLRPLYGTPYRCPGPVITANG